MLIFINIIIFLTGVFGKFPDHGCRYILGENDIQGLVKHFSGKGENCNRSYEKIKKFVTERFGFRVERSGSCLQSRLERGNIL